MTIALDYGRQMQANAKARRTMEMHMCRISRIIKRAWDAAMKFDRRGAVFVEAIVTRSAVDEKSVLSRKQWDDAMAVMLRQGLYGGLSAAYETRTGRARVQKHGDVATKHRHPADMEAEQRAQRAIHANMQRWFRPSKKRSGWA
jgi:hypothetical protein